jgi:hypothetical protein
MSYWCVPVTKTTGLAMSANQVVMHASTPRLMACGGPLGREAGQGNAAGFEGDPLCVSAPASLSSGTRQPRRTRQRSGRPRRGSAHCRELTCLSSAARRQGLAAIARLQRPGAAVGQDGRGERGEPFAGCPWGNWLQGPWLAANGIAKGCRVGREETPGRRPSECAYGHALGTAAPCPCPAASAAPPAPDAAPVLEEHGVGQGSKPTGTAVEPAGQAIDGNVVRVVWGPVLVQ